MYDTENNEIVQLILYYFPFDNSFEILNAKKGKKILKRTQIPTVTKKNLYLGNTLFIYSRLIHIIGCSDPTYTDLFQREESTFALIKPIDIHLIGKIINFITNNGFRIVRLKNGLLTKDLAHDLFDYTWDQPFMSKLVEYLLSGNVIGLELMAPNAIEKWRDCIGDKDPEKAKPGTLRAMYGKDIIKNVAFASKSKEQVQKNIKDFFGYSKDHPHIPFTATMQNCTCCIIKPHAITEGKLGLILNHIILSDKFYIAAMAMFNIRIWNAMEFYEIYKGVLPTYKAMAVELSDDRCLVLEVKSKDPSVKCTVSEFRELCGPRDPELCRHLYPNSIRALYGKDIVHNAVHCTDLPEDGEQESEYFFRLLAFKHEYKV